MTYLDYIQLLHEDPTDEALLSAFSDFLLERGEASRAGGIQLHLKLKAQSHIYLGPNHFWPDCPSFVTWHLHLGVAVSIEVYEEDFLGYAKHIFQAQPIQKVILRNKVPWDHEDGVRWEVATTGSHETCGIHPRIYWFLKEGWNEMGGNMTVYQSNEDAFEDLSQAARSFGLQEADFPFQG